MPKLPPDLAKQPGDMIEEFRIVRVLGAGAFGIVYQAENTYLPETVAVKEFLPRELAHRDAQGQVVPVAAQHREMFDWARGRFLEEARNLWQLAQDGAHPNIVRVTRYCEANGTAYMFMAFETGRPLNVILHEQGRVTPEQLDKLFEPLLDGLQRVHENHIIHRDIKPENILIRADGSPVLIDFGAARRVAAQTERSIVSTYTPVYAALEQQQTIGELGPWTDIYCLGATLYRAVTGALPLGAPERLYGIEQQPATALAAGYFNPTLLAAIDAACAVRPEDRPQSIGEWRRLLRAGAVSDDDDAATRIVSRPNEPTEIIARPSIDTRAVAQPTERIDSSSGRGFERPAAEQPTAVASIDGTRSDGPARASKGRTFAAIGLGMVVLIAAALGWTYRDLILRQLPVAPTIPLGTETAEQPQVDQPLPPQPRTPATDDPAIAEPAPGSPEPTEEPEATPAPPAEDAASPAPLASTEPIPIETAPEPEPEPEEPAPERTLITAGGRFADPLAEGGSGPIMVWLPAGEFRMGSPEDEPGRHPDERAFRARVPEPIAVSETELTIGQFRRFVDSSGYHTEVDRSSTCLRPDADWSQLVPDMSLSWDLPGHAVDDRHPVACISWNDAQAYTAWLSQQTGKSYRLPTELEWEYAARGTTESSRFWGNDPADGCTRANTAECDDDYRYTAPAGTFAPNPFGLRSVLGNLAEWTCSDYGSGYFGNESRCGAADAGTTVRVFRGGSWLDAPALVRSAARDAAPANLGLSTVGARLLRELDPATERTEDNPLESATARGPASPTQADTGPAAPRSTN